MRRSIWLCVACVLLFWNVGHAQEPEIRKIVEGRGDILILFVHGLSGDAETTWINQRTERSWPHMLADDPSFATADVATFDYPTSVWESGILTISQISDNLRTILDSEDNRIYEKIIFVSHSMGGLITRNFLLKNRDYLEKVPFVFFLATPTGGSNLADIGTWLRLSSRQVQGLQELENNSFLADQTSSWLSWREARTLKSYCAYETVTTYRVIVVEQASAQLLCTEAPIPVAENHSNVAKPRDGGSITYITLKTAFQKAVSIPLFDPRLEGRLVVNDVWRQSADTIIADEFILTDDIVLDDGTAIFVNRMLLNDNRLSATNLSVVAGEIHEGTIDVSGAQGQSGSELVVAAGSINGARLLARGGNGKDGRDGETGADGRGGARGRDGNCDGFGRYRGAGAGEPGQHGTDGEDGEHGQNGGNGGRLFVVSLNNPSSIITDVKGGRGGIGGHGGAGGRGGQGGQGGRGCVGLGGAQTNAANGTNGNDGRNGLDGRDGKPGEDGEQLVAQIVSLAQIGELLPPSDQLIDYRQNIVNEIRATAFQR